MYRIPTTNQHAHTIFNFAAYDKRLYPNPLHPFVDYMIKPQKHIKKCTNLPSRQDFVHLRCCVLRPYPGILLSLYKGATIRLPGGGLGFSVWSEYFFLSLSGPKYFFSIYHEPEYFFLKPYWARIFFSIQYKGSYKFGSNFLVEPQIG